MQVLLVEDNTDLREEVAWALRQAGFTVQEFGDARGLDPALACAGPFVLVLDLGLPSGDGLDVARRLAGRANLAIVMMTARIRREDRIAGHMTGADVYLTKPVDLDEMVAVVRGMHRRLSAAAGDDHLANSWSLQMSTRRLACPQGDSLELTGQECEILAALALTAPQTLSRRKLAEVLGHNYMVFDFRRIETAISRLRRKAQDQGLAELPVQALRGQGYAFAAPLRVT